MLENDPGEQPLALGALVTLFLFVDGAATFRAGGTERARDAGSWRGGGRG